MERFHQPAAAADGCASLFIFVLFAPWLPVGLGLAAGAMIWMVFAELIPDAYEGGASGAAIGIAVTLAFAALLAFQEFVLVF